MIFYSLLTSGIDYTQNSSLDNVKQIVFYSGPFIAQHFGM